jgi:hypothetical protein
MIMTMMMRLLFGLSMIGVLQISNTVMAQQQVRTRQLTDPIFRFVLMNADTEKEIMNLVDGSVITLSALSTKNLNLQAIPVRNVDAVQFDYDGVVNFYNEWHAPYALCHNLNGRFEPCSRRVFKLGKHTLTATGKRGGRNVGSQTITFTVVNSPVRPH